MNETEPSSVKSADRVLDLFELLARRRRGMSHAEISEALGIPKSSLTQLIKNLLKRDYLSFSAEERHYLLGQKFAQLARQTSLAQDVVSLTEPLLVDIAHKTGESCALNIRDGNELKVVASVNGMQTLVTHLRTGDRAPLYATSGGKAILAFLSEDSFEEYIAQTQLGPITPNTITSLADLRKQLARVRADGIADVFDEFTNGIVGIAAPILVNGEPIASINVAIPTVRYNSEVRYIVVDALKSAVETLDHHLS